jgi:hypothetical protein
MRSFLKRVLSFFSPIFLVVVGVNYFGDAANLFSDSYESKVAEEIVNGNNVTNILNCDERVLQRLIINKLDYCPDIVVIGSSRIMEIRQSMFKESSLMNNGVSGATIEDLLALIELYETKNCLPKRIIMGLDPWTLNKNNEQVRWRALESEYLANLKRLKIDDNPIFNISFQEGIKNVIKSQIKYYQLVSPSYFKISLKMLLFQNKSVFLTKNNFNDTFTRLSDGSVSYGLEYRSKNDAEVNKKVSQFIRGNLYSIQNFTELEKGIQLQLESLIIHLKSRNVEIEFFLAPYHPDVYKIVEKEPYLMVLESEKFFLFLAKQHQIKVFGSFDPQPFSLSKSFFYDGMHCDSNAINLLLKSNRTNFSRSL